jgi:hypothetical protein
MTTVTITPEAAIAEWEAQLAGLGEQGDVALTLNAQAEFVRKQSFLMGHIRSARIQSQNAAEAEAQIPPLESWRDHLRGWVSTLGTEASALAANDRRQMNYMRSIEVINRGLQVLRDSGHMLESLRLGQLMRESGFEQNVPPPAGEAMLRLPWLGSLPEVDRQLRDLTTRRDDARQALEALLRESV